MEIVVVGVNHRKAPVELRERLAFDPKNLGGALEALRAAAGSSEQVILSTCNRVELYVVREGEDSDALEAAAAFLARQRGCAPEEVRPVLYSHAGSKAVRHLFEVTASLDSMVLGETQIIAQVKQSYLTAKEAGHTGRIFNPLFQRALAVAKRIHTTTSLGSGSVSVSSVAAKLAEKIFQDLAGKRVLILGAGETGALTLQAFRERGARDILVVNRTVETARTLAEQVGGTGHGLEELPVVLGRADIIIACLSVEQPIVRIADVRAALRTRRNEAMFFIDIAVPRAIEAEIDRLDNAYLFNIDDLQEIVSQNLLERERELTQCAPVVETETEAVMRELATLDIQHVLTTLRSTFEAVGAEELKRALGRMTSLAPEQREEVETLVHRLVNKFLHHPTTVLKEEAQNGLSPSLIELTSRLFRLK
ncbi:MAG: glutamyl-tRNA reductase [Planctomycetes bacterium]|nr:glutamyl-tRNA reductase [Planctomycetota bacterium]